MLQRYKFYLRLLIVCFPLWSVAQNKDAVLSKEQQETIERCNKSEVKLQMDDCIISVGKIYYENNILDKAQPYFEEAAFRFSKDQKGVSAATVLLDILVQKGNSKELEEAAKKISEVEEYKKDTALHKTVSKILISVESIKCQDSYKEKRYSEAGDCYLLLSKKVENKEKVTALYNAAVSLDGVKRFADSIEARKQIIDSPASKGSSERERAMFTLAMNYLSFLDIENALLYFERYSKEYPATQDSELALLNAAYLQEGTENYDAAINSVKKYIQMISAKPSSNADEIKAYLYLATLQEKKKDLNQTKATYEKLLKAQGKHANENDLAYVYAKLSLLLRNAKKTKEANTYCGQAMKIFASAGSGYSFLGKSVDSIAECAFYVIEEQYSKKKKIQAPKKYNKEELTNWLTELQKERELAREKYIEVRTYGSDIWTFAALYKIGQIDLQLSSEILKTPIPKEIEIDGEIIVLTGDLKKEIEKEVREAVTDLANTPKQQAIETFSKCTQLASDVGTQNDWTLQCEEALYQIDPVKFPKMVEWLPSPDDSASFLYAPGIILTPKADH